MNKNYKKLALRIIYRVVYYIYKVFLFFPWILGKILGWDDMASNMIIPFAEAVENMSSCYTTVKFRSKKEEACYHPLIDKKAESFEDCAIVIQGPVLKKEDFTFETAKIYASAYPKVHIIISCWTSEEKKYCEKFAEIDQCDVIYNKIPEHSGYGNINLQQVSSQGGIKRAKELGCLYVLKQRSDVRICDLSFLGCMRYFINKYPCRDSFCIQQKKRIIIFNAPLLIPFSHADYYAFGDTDDMISYWSFPLAKEDNVFKGNEMANYIAKNHLSLRERVRDRMSGESFPYYYMHHKNDEVEYTISAWWKALSDYFICFPHTMSDFLWYKYDYNHEESNLYRTHVRTIFGGNEEVPCVDFYQWVQMNEGKFSLDPMEYEYLVDKHF